MTAYTTGMNQFATYWAPGNNDGFGDVVYNAPPVRIACRWQEKKDLVRNAQGQEVVSSATVYVDRELLPRGYLAFGDLTGDVDSDGFSDPRDEALARQIINVGTSPSIAADQILHKVWL